MQIERPFVAPELGDQALQLARPLRDLDTDEESRAVLHSEVHELVLKGDRPSGPDGESTQADELGDLDEVLPGRVRFLAWLWRLNHA